MKQSVAAYFKKAIFKSSVWNLKEIAPIVSQEKFYFVYVFISPIKSTSNIRSMANLF